MKLLIITPTLGNSPFLRETVDSIAAAAPDALHVVVCPPRAVAATRQACPTARVIPEPPAVGGLYGAVNHGVAEVHEPWEWMTYINDDDTLDDGFRLALRRVRPDDGIGYGRVDKIDEAGRRVGEVSTLRSPRWFLPLAAGGISGFNQQGALIHHEVWQRVGPFDASYRICADFDFFVRAARAGARLHYLGTTTGAFRIRRGQISHDVGLETAEKQRLHATSQLDRHARSAPVAKAIFRLQNARLYFARLRRAEFRTSHEMLAHGFAGKAGPR